MKSTFLVPYFISAINISKFNRHPDEEIYIADDKKRFSLHLRFPH